VATNPAAAAKCRPLSTNWLAVVAVLRTSTCTKALPLTTRATEFTSTGAHTLNL
jgi:hypothetical protein